jgi:hypothetical protein
MSHRGCKVCGEKDPRCLDFHHRIPVTKTFQIATDTHKTWGIVLSEVEKCDVLCSNCHRKTHMAEYEL